MLLKFVLEAPLSQQLGISCYVGINILILQCCPCAASQDAPGAEYSTAAGSRGVRREGGVRDMEPMLQGVGGVGGNLSSESRYRFVFV